MSEGIYYSADGNIFHNLNEFLDIKDKISSKSYSNFSNLFNVFDWVYYYEKLCNEIYDVHKQIFKREPNEFTLDFIVDMVNFIDHYEALKLHEGGFSRKKDEFILHDNLKQYGLALRAYLKDQSEENAIEIINSTKESFFNIYADPVKYLGLFTIIRGNITENIFQLYDLEIQTKSIDYIGDYIDSKYDELDAKIIYDLTIYKENFLGMFDINEHLKYNFDNLPKGQVIPYLYVLGLNSVLNNDNKLNSAIKSAKKYSNEVYECLVRINQRKKFYSEILNKVYDSFEC